MRLYNINRKFYAQIDSLPVLSEFDSTFFKSLLLEDQIDYLKKKYPEIDEKTIQQAIDLDRKNAEKLLYGLKTGVIKQIDQESLAAVAGLDPFKKDSGKSEADLAYEAAIRRAKEINPNYWQWILRVQKENPEARFDEGLFHYIEGAGISPDRLKSMSLEEVERRSRKWHEEQFSQQKAGGEYHDGIDKAVFRAGPYYFVPVSTKDAVTEGHKMQNCIGSFCNPSDTTKVYSMRNAYNNPHVSISVKKHYNSDYWYICEIKGKQNKKPVEAYVPYATAFIDYLFTQQGCVLDGSSGDALDILDLNKYAKYYVGNIDQIANKLSDKTLNEAVAIRGLYHVDEAIVKRLTRDTIVGLLHHNRALNMPGAHTDWNPARFITFAVKYRKLSEAEATQLAETQRLPRSAHMVIYATYHPEEFIQEISKVPVDDLAAAASNYVDAIEAYPQRHVLFGKIAQELITSQARNRDDILKCVLAKSPIKYVVQLLGAVGEPDNSMISFILYALSEILASDNFEDKYAILSMVPREFKMPRDLADVIVYSTSFEQLPQLYNLHNAQINLRIKYFMSAIGKLPADELSYYTIRGSEGFIRDADVVLRIDDMEQLRKLRSTTKSRSVKKLVDRKLARLQRLEDAKHQPAV